MTQTAQAKNSDKRPMQKGIDCVIFDLDGTIADTIPLLVECFRRVFQKYLGYKYPPSEIVSMFGPTEQGIIASRVPRKDRDRAVAYFYRSYSSLLPSKAWLFDGVDMMLRQLGFMQKSLGIATGKGKRSTCMTLRGFGIQSYFSVVITGDDVPEPKPSPKILMEAIDQIGSLPEETLYVGDTPVDIVCGRRAGVVTGAALWGAADREELLHTPPDLIFKHPREIVQIVQGRMP